MKNTGSQMIDQLKDNFKAFENNLNGVRKSSWHQLRKEALESFVQNGGFPKVKDEEYRYTHIGRVLEKTFDFSNLSGISEQNDHDEQPLFHDADAIHIFINNGIVNKTKLKTLEHPKLDVLSLQEAFAKYPNEIETHLGKLGGVKKDPFLALNTAFSHEGVFIKIQKNAAIEKPIVLHYSTDSTSGNGVHQSRNLIVVEQGVQANIIETNTSASTENQFSNHVSEIIVGANANINYFKLQNQSDRSYHIDNSYISQARDSVVTSYTFTFDGKLVRNNLNFLLEEENCEAHMFGLYYAREDGLIDNHTSVDHQVANCYSNEIYKGILDDTSKGVFNGKIFVRKDAQKTNAFQTNKNILLTDTASINTKPQLEIWADDVSCSHGSTTGQLDEEQLFYLRSRGISKSSARAMLLHAFVNDVIDKIKIDFLHDYINKEMYQRLD